MKHGSVSAAGTIYGTRPVMLSSASVMQPCFPPISDTVSSSAILKPAINSCAGLPMDSGTANRMSDRRARLQLS